MLTAQGNRHTRGRHPEGCCSSSKASEQVPVQNSFRANRVAHSEQVRFPEVP